MKFKILALSVIVTLSGCAHVEPNIVERPSGSVPFNANNQELLAYGEELWNDPKLGTSGLSCANCHTSGASFSESFKEPYPHGVSMAQSLSGLKSVDAEQMVQFCMLQPMKANILPWDSKELAALTLYVEKVVQPDFINK